MARYIDVDKVELKGLAVFDENLDVLVPLSVVRKALQMTPTADVVPKSEVDMCQHLIKDAWKRIEELDELCGELQKAKAEVAREIFEEIEELLECSFSSCHINGTEEQFDFYRADLGFQLAELKKKYTEE